MALNLNKCFSTVEIAMVLPIQAKKDDLINKNKQIKEEIPQLEGLVETQKCHLQVINRTITHLSQQSYNDVPITTDLRKLYAELKEPYEVILQNLLGKKDQLQKNIEIIADCDLRISVIKEVLVHFEPVEEYNEDDI
jgi:hypothetical protein